MKDNDVIKALECCKMPAGSGACNNCPLKNVRERRMTEKDTKSCTTILLESTLDLIKRQKAELERLKAVKEAELDTIHNLGEDYEKALEEINRKNAEIERLRTECGKQSVLWSEHFEALFQTAKETIRPKARKELAERVKEKLHKEGGCGAEKGTWARGWDDAITRAIAIVDEEMESERK